MSRVLLLTSMVGLLVVSSTGCTIRPLHRQEVFNDRTLFQGFAPKPDMPIHVQVYDANIRDWVTIDTVFSMRFPLRNRSLGQEVIDAFAGQWDGNFYFWDAGLVRIPQRYWHQQIGLKVAYARVIMDGGQPLASYSSTPNLHADPVQEFSDHGAYNFGDGFGVMALYQRD